MTTALPGYAPTNDEELARDFHDRIRKLETSSTVRVGPWVLSAAGDGNLRATRPGQTVVIDESGAVQEVAPQALNLSGLVTTEQLESALEEGGPDIGEIAQSVFSDLYHAITGALNPVNALSALARFFRIELGGLIPSFRLPLLPLSHIRNVQPNLLTDGGFDREESLAGFDDWDYDDIDGRTKAGCAYTMADGNTHVLRSNSIEVDPGDRLNVEVYTRWLSLASTAGAIQLAISSYTSADVLIGTAVVAQTQGAGTIEGWATKLSVSNWAPPEGADYIVIEPTVGTGASSGVVKFDDAACRKVGAFPQSFVGGLVNALQDAAQGLQGIINAVGGKAQSFLADVIERLKNLTPQGIFNAIGIGNIGALPAIDLSQVLDLPDFLDDLGDNIADVFDDVRRGWNAIWSGFFRQPGSTGKTAEDIETVMVTISTDIILAHDTQITLANLANAPKNVPLWVSPNPFEDVAYPRSEIEPRLVMNTRTMSQSGHSVPLAGSWGGGTASTINAHDHDLTTELPVFTVPAGDGLATTVSTTYNRIYNDAGIITDGSAVPPQVFVGLYLIDPITGNRTLAYDFGDQADAISTGALDLYDQRFLMTHDLQAAAGDHYELMVLPVGGSLNLVGKPRKGIKGQAVFYPAASTERLTGLTGLPASYTNAQLDHSSPYRMFGSLSQSLGEPDTSPITLNETFNYGATNNWQSASWNRFGNPLQLVGNTAVQCFQNIAVATTYRASRLAKVTMHQDDHQATVTTQGGWSGTARDGGATTRAYVRCRNTGNEGVALHLDGSGVNVRVRIATVASMLEVGTVRATSTADVVIDPAVADDWTIRAEGNVYRGYHNGEFIPGVEWDDSTLITSRGKNFRSVGFGTDQRAYNSGFDRALSAPVHHFVAVDLAAVA